MRSPLEQVCRQASFQNMPLIGLPRYKWENWECRSCGVSAVPLPTWQIVTLYHRSNMENTAEYVLQQSSVSRQLLKHLIGTPITTVSRSHLRASVPSPTPSRRHHPVQISILPVRKEFWLSCDVYSASWTVSSLSYVCVFPLNLS